MNNLSSIITKQKDFFFSSKELIEIQSKFYYDNTGNSQSLGYETLVEQQATYPDQIYKFITNLIVNNNEKVNLTFLELGAGTGKFCKKITQLMSDDNVSYSYTIVDVADVKFKSIFKNDNNITIVKSSFEEFVKKNKKKYDFLIMNEALDMWAGLEVILDKWEDKTLPLLPFWVLLNNNTNEFVKKKDVKKINIDEISNFEWLFVIYDQKFKNIREIENFDDFRIKIKIPELFYSLLDHIGLFTLVHDYWCFNDDSNGLRSQFVINNNEKEKSTWVFNTTIPFGKVDVTYSPDQSEFLDVISQTDLQLTSLDMSDVGKFDDSIYRVAEENSEVFLLFTKKAIELQYTFPKNL